MRTQAIPIFLVVSSCLVSAPRERKPFVLQELTEADSISGAGAYFYIANPTHSGAKEIFSYSDIKDGGCIRINNQTFRLKQVSRKVLKKGAGRRGLGERKLEIWSAGTTIIELDYIVTSLEEEGLNLTGQLTVKFDNKSQTYKIKGYWGD